MLPTTEQIALAAYHRWERRSHHHGRHDHDWLAAEQELIFAANYQIIARYRLDGIAPHHLGDPDEPRCRLCERAEPGTTFAGPRLATPGVLGNEAIFTRELCNECHAQYRESVGGDLERFVRAVRSGGPETPQAFVPAAAFKGLAWAALMLLPGAEMQYLEEAVEWVSNPDHDLDSRSIGGVECILHRLPEPSPFAWAALARRVDDDAPYPYLVAFFATGPLVFQFPLPLCGRDEELEGRWNLPKVPWPLGGNRSPLDSHHAVIPLASSRPRQGSHLEFAGP